MPLIRGSAAPKSIYDDQFTMKYIEARKSKTVLIKKPIKKSRRVMLRQIFDGFDYEGTGDISADDLKKALMFIFDHSEEGKGARRSIRDAKWREISDMVAEIDNDGSGEIDFDEFCEFMTSQEGNKSGKSKKEGGQDVAQLQDLFVNHQRGVQLNSLTHHHSAKTIKDEMNVSESMKCFEFLFKSHMAGFSGEDEETKAKTANDMKSRHYYMTKQQRANMAGGSDNIPPVLVIETVGDTTHNYKPKYAWKYLTIPPLPIDQFKNIIYSFKKKINFHEQYGRQWGKTLIVNGSPTVLSIISQSLANIGIVNR
jgi:hypothetical protein